MSKIILYFTLILLVMGFTTSQMFAQSGDDKAGSVGMKFLTFASGARGAAMGEAYTALVDDASAFFWNPGVLGTLEGLSLHFTWSQYLLDTKYFTGVVSYPLDFATVAVGVSFVDYGDVIETSFDATGLSFKRTGNVLSPSDLAFGVSLAKQLTDKFSVGATVKFIREDLVTATANGVAFDVGTIFDTGYRNIKIGASFTNFGPDVNFSGDNGWSSSKDVPLPQSFRIGMTIDSKGFSQNENVVGTFSVDLIKNTDTVQRLALGGEIDLASYLQVRGGYVVGFDESEVSYGAGVHFNWEGREVRADFAISALDDFSSTDIQRFSVGINF